MEEQDILAFIPKGTPSVYDKELYDLRADGKIESVPDKPGVGFKQQKMQALRNRPSSITKKGIIAYEVGAGKTCTAIMMAEASKAYTDRKVYYLTPNEDLVQDVKRSLLKTCTAVGEYEVKADRIYPQYYVIMPIGRFLSSLPKAETQIRSIYGNTRIYIDEAHITRPQISSGPSAARKEIMGVDRSVTPEQYEILHRFLHIIYDTAHIYAMTGTPIWDREYEIASLANLVLPMDKQLPKMKKFTKEFFDKETNTLKPEKKKELKKTLKGLISYYRTSSSDTKKIMMGDDTLIPKLTLYTSKMSEYQSEVANSVATKGGLDAISVGAKSSNICVFPSKTDDYEKAYGSKGFSYNITGKKGNYAYRDDFVKQEMKDNLSKYSAIFASIIKSIKDHPTEVAFIYLDAVKTSGGVINLGLILELAGFRWAKRANNIATPQVEDGNRFVILSSAKGTIYNPAEVSKTLRYVGDPRNKYGRMCRIVIVTRKLSMGITVKNARQCHIVFPHWNFAGGVDQPEGRVYRPTVADAFATLDEKYLRTYYHNVSYHADSFDTQSLHVWKICVDKDERNAAIRRVIKEVAWDCPLQYLRNVTPEDKKVSRVCDYQDCNYRCDGFPRNSIDKSGKVWQYNIKPEDISFDTYDLLFSQDLVNEYKEKIYLMFQKHFALSYEVIKETLGVPEGRDMVLLHALDYIVQTKTYIQNRYGFPSFLHEAGNIYYIAEDHITSSKKPLSLDSLATSYSKYPIIIKTEDIMSKIEKYELRHDTKKMALYRKDGDLKHLQDIYRIRDIYEKYFQDPGAAGVLDKIIPSQYKPVVIDGVTYHKIPENRYITETERIRIYDKNENGWRNATAKEISTFNRSSSSVQIRDIFKDREFYAVRIPNKTGINITFPENGIHRKGTRCTSFSKAKLIEIGKKLGITMDNSIVRNEMCAKLEKEFEKQNLIWE